MASLTAFSGMVMQGKEYIAPCTGLQLMPCTVLRTCSVSLAFSAKVLKVAVRSWMWKREEKTQIREDGEKREVLLESGNARNNFCDP